MSIATGGAMPSQPSNSYGAFMNKILQLASSAQPLQAGADGWVMIFPSGTSKGFDGRGPYVLQDPEAVIAASVRPKVDLLIDRDHATDELPKGSEVPAAGWIKELAARADGIYARVEWVSRAAQQIAEKEYRYISPVFYFDKASGVVSRILRASLTNNPNLEVKAVAAADTETTQPKKETKMNETLLAIAKLLGLGDDATEAAVLKAIQDKTEALAKVSSKLGLAADASAEAVLTALEQKATAAAKNGNPDPEKFVPREMFDSLSNQVKELAKAGADREANEAVDAAVKAGKIAPAQKAWALEYASSNLKGFNAFVEGAPVIVAGGQADGKDKPEAAAAKLDGDQKTICDQLGITGKQFSEAVKAA